MPITCRYTAKPKSKPIDFDRSTPAGCFGRTTMAPQPAQSPHYDFAFVLGR